MTLQQIIPIEGPIASRTWDSRVGVLNMLAIIELHSRIVVTASPEGQIMAGDTGQEERTVQLVSSQMFGSSETLPAQEVIAVMTRRR